MKKYLFIVSSLFILGISACKKESDSTISSASSVRSIRNLAPTNMDQAYWRIDILTLNGSDVTTTYRNYVYHFTEKGQIFITHDFGRNTVTGNWNLTGEGPMSFFIDLDENSASLAPDNLSVIEGNWAVVSFTETKIDLVKDNGSTHLRFDRL